VATFPPVAIHRSSVALVVALLGFCAGLAHAQQAPFEPKVGQAGKDVVWVPTPQELVDKMLDMAKVTPDDSLLDLGSGDGVTVITAARRGARAHGIEYDARMVELSRRNAEAAHVASRATFAKADLFDADFSSATVITMFLLPQINMQLRPRLLDLKPGTRIVSNTFTMQDWAPDGITGIDPCDRWCFAYLWIVPARVAGTWRMRDSDLVLSQRFQKVSGMFGASPLIDARLRGEEIAFTVGLAAYIGRVNGDRMSGTVTQDGRTAEWRATRE
jgi:hypothetical protein